ncbi:alpha-L-fucosidase [Paenibacillus sp. CC-CFT747]|nr:alpha-L-fucosidase [Paenibacillus sp. CC-CFT747]
MTSLVTVPAHLKGYEELYRTDPRAASLQWFQDAKFGLFIHYGLYSIPARGEWVMYHEKIHVAGYEKLKDEFTADQFDAEAIADLAVEAGMKYINLTTRHHDSFCLFESQETDFHSVHSPAKRDLVAELAAACEKRGLGLFLYYSYGIDWRHPYAPNNDSGVYCARPNYDEPEPAYLGRTDADVRKYVDFMHKQLTELLTNYGSVAGIWFDLITACYYRPDLFPVQDTYDLIRGLQPHCLISFKQGVNGDEDYMSQEIHFVPLKNRLIQGGASEEAVRMSEEVWQKHITKWNEVCTILQNKGWGYMEGAGHKSADEVMDLLARTLGKRCNLLLNIAPVGSGALQPVEVEILREVGRRIAGNGWPEPVTEEAPASQVDTGAGAE